MIDLPDDMTQDEYDELERNLARAIRVMVWLDRHLELVRPPVHMLFPWISAN